ncbi:MAG: metalloprotease TldD [Acidobacteria bacterium]|nr:MAG: metalloprotease TldD [Acidobacteriota bacterium]
MSNAPTDFFARHYGVSPTDLERYLAAALARGGDFADLYFEHQASSSLRLEEGIIKSASQGISLGVGVRVLSGERTGYAYTDDLSPEKILRAAATAAHIASGATATHIVGLSDTPPGRNLYPVAAAAAGDTGMLGKLALVRRAERAAREHDARIVQVQVGYADELRQILVVASDGRCSADAQPMARLSVLALARENGVTEKGHSGGGGRVALEFFDEVLTPEALGEQAAREAVQQLAARPCPAGEMEVVLGPGWPGILLHEAIGHGLEADFNRKKTSAFSGLLGQRVASEKCTVVDNGTLPGRRGSLNMDDEGAPTHCTTLIENGILKNYMQDELSARLTGAASTGNGRRESYAHMPMPRMTNTYMLAGNDEPADIIRSVRRGLYAVNFGGGQVDITNGKFVFSASESYLIEDGKITAPVKGATLIGNGPDVLTRVSMVGNDLKLDQGIGTCGKDGQSVPVGVGIPTLKVDRLTVGGTQ